MKVLILAAGYGTRLYPLITDTPKVLLDINGRSLLDYILDKVKGLSGLSEVLVVTNDKFEENLKEWAGSYPKNSFKITIINDGTQTPEDRLGSIGDINFVLEQDVVDEDLLVIGGDNLFDYDLDDYLKFAQEKSPSVTIGLFDITDLNEAKRFGVVALDEQRQISSFEEKPEAPKSSLIAMCLYFFPKTSLSLVGEYLSQTDKSDKAGDYIRWLCGKDAVFGYNFEGNWFDIGTIESYKEAQKFFK